MSDICVPVEQAAAGQLAWAVEGCACLLCTCSWLGDPVLTQTLWAPLDDPGCWLHPLAAGLGQHMCKHIHTS